MNCEHCTEFLADFLLDELPEAEAVLIQEHLNICPACMKTYRELKGTGKALEAVPALRSVKGSPDFTRVVRAEAAVESAKIIEALPTDKRMRVEARRAARLSKFASQRASGTTTGPRSRVWAVVLALVVAATALCLILFSGNGGLLTPHTQLGTLSLTTGPVESGNAREGRSPRSAREGQTIYSGDSIITPDNGRARIDLNDGTALFIGPATHIILEPQSSTVEAFSIVVDGGELGLNRPILSGDKKLTLMKWDVQSDLGMLQPEPGTQLFVSVSKSGSGFNGSALVVTGNAIVVSRAGGTEVTTTLGPGSKYLEGTGHAKGRTESVADARVPAWRVELATESDLQRILSGHVKVLSRSGAGIEVELVYGHTSNLPGDDWAADPAGATAGLSQRPDGTLVIPNGRLRHVIPFAGPLSYALTLNRDVRPERNLAFGALFTPERGVSVDVSREAALQVRVNNTHAHSSTIAAHKDAEKSERLALDITAEKGGLSAVMTSKEEKSQAFQLPAEFSGRSGQLWLQALSDGITMDEIKITGTIPAEWLSEALSAKR
jgi:hypothetical protein